MPEVINISGMEKVGTFTCNLPAGMLSEVADYKTIRRGTVYTDGINWFPVLLLYFPAADLASPWDWDDGAYETNFGVRVPVDDIIEVEFC